jgi:N-acetylneuraminic acid mutarotase
VQATVLPTSLPTGLSRSVAVVVGSRILVYGGFTSSGITTDAILRFDPAGGEVAAAGHLAVPVHDAAGVALGGATLIFGGGSAAPTSAVQRIDASGIGQRIGNLPAARADLSAAVVGSSAIVIAGGASGLLDRRIVTTDDGVHFHTLATLVAGVRYAAVAEVGGLLYVIGGAGAEGDRTEIQLIDPASGKVTVIGRMPRPISHASAMVIDGRLLVVGGRSAGKAQDAIWQVDVSTGKAGLVGHLPQAVSDFPVAVIGNTGYLIGGETGTQIASIVSVVIQ